MKQLNLIGSLLFCALAAPAFGGVISGDRVVMLYGEKPMSLSEMSETRGGFVDVSGLIRDFTVNVHTALNGAMIFSRSLVVAPSPETGQFAASATSNVISQNVPTDVIVSEINKGAGVTIIDPAGQQTTILNQTDAGAPASVVMNTASQQNITQTVDVVLTLKNMATVMNYVHNSTQSAAMVQNNAMRSLRF